MQFRYTAILTRQTGASAPLALFAAPAAEIDRWSGIPEKKRFGDDETAGFQREQNPGRVKDLSDFFGDPKNVIQNPLLCATRDLPGSTVAFEGDAPSSAGEIATGVIVITIAAYDDMPLAEVFARVRANITP